MGMNGKKSLKTRSFWLAEKVNGIFAYNFAVIGLISKISWELKKVGVMIKLHIWDILILLRSILKISHLFCPLVIIIIIILFHSLIVIIGLTT